MNEFPSNSNNTTEVHKLQGTSNDALIVSSFPNKQLRSLFKNLEYVVLSWVRKLEWLYIFEPIDMNDSFEPTDQLKVYGICDGKEEKRYNF